jgi:4-hydroxy-tetrahydrodipicolinate synthase
VTATKDKFGLSVALATPFRADGTIDLPRLVEHARWCLAHGCDSVTLFGTTGEGASIGIAGRTQALGALAGVGFDMGRQVCAGVAAASVQDAAEQARLALGMGCRALLVAPPFYFKGVSDDGLFAWFSRFFEAVPGIRDVILYHIPSVTAVGISPALISRLREAFPGVVTGLKDSSGDYDNTQKLLDTHGDLAILVGDERQLAEAVRHGGQGTICGLANFCPDLLRPVVHEGKDDPRIAPIVEAVCALPVLPAVKALIARRTGDAAWTTMRPPLEPLTEAQARGLGAAFERITGAKAA